MKVFISQPMRGKTEEEILEVRNEIMNYATSKYGHDIEIVDSFFSEIINPDFCSESDNLPHPLVLLGESLKLLADADVAIFATDWLKARGCRIEHECCIAYDILVDYYREDPDTEPVSDYY